LTALQSKHCVAHHKVTEEEWVKELMEKTFEEGNVDFE